MERIYAPWRAKYVQGGVNEPGCVLCKAYAARDQEESLVLQTGRENFVLLNLYPYTSGHLMVAPVRHVASLTEATRLRAGRDDGRWPAPLKRRCARPTTRRGSTWA